MQMLTQVNEKWGLAHATGVHERNTRAQEI